ncbi:alkaline phosphatase family protein [Fluviispira vulneris]|uniref:alkaline phosphatase family protein n=1 Tax=Fluviispira vulneris TaxID=2763012 RepID=UPI0016474152|nr:alkaline phosphatase family protein [Fluviispira vulneris]
MFIRSNKFNYFVTCLSIVTITSCQTHKNVSEMSQEKNNLASKNKIILYVWDGLRPDVLTDPKAKDLIPNLIQLAKNGVEFKNNHSSYPTFTMLNAQVFATGSNAGKSGFYGNTLYYPWRALNKNIKEQARDANGTDITSSFLEPFFTQDYKILQSIDQPQVDEPLIQVTTLMQEAQKNGLVTAVVGKSGSAFIQDYKAQGYILDEKHAWPLEFAKELQEKNISLPKYTANAYNPGQLILSENNGDPIKKDKVYYLGDVSEGTDPIKGNKSPYNAQNEYMSNIFINNIIPDKSPDLSVLWLRNPDSTEHAYGPGSSAYYDALSANDKILGKLVTKLKELNLDKKTNIIIVSDHSHSNILATKRDDENGFPQLMYDLHQLVSDENGNHKIGPATQSEKVHSKKNNEKLLITNGISVSGTIRTADLITKAKLKTKDGYLIAAYDGGDCSFNAGLSGIRKSDGQIHTSSLGYNKPDAICKDKSGKNLAFTSPAYPVPSDLSNSDKVEKIVIAPNGGTDYIYLPNHNPEVLKELTRFFQRRQEYSAIFVDDLRYKLGSHFPNGALPLSYVKLANTSGRNPDIIVSLTSNSNVIVNGLKGTEYDSTDGDWQRGNHGSFGKIDIHNTLLAFGPDFKEKTSIDLPTGNVDVAPTIATLLGLKLGQTDGRPLLEALKNSNVSESNINVTSMNLTSSAVCDLEIYHPTTHPFDFDSKVKNDFIDRDVNSYYTELNVKVLTTHNGNRYVYFDEASAKRQKGCPKVGFTQFDSEYKSKVALTD